MWVSMCFPRAVDSYFIVKKRPYSLAKIATGGVRPGYLGDAPMKVQHLSGCEIGVNVNLLDN